MAVFRRALDFIAILILLAFFLLGLMGNREGEGQFFLMMTLGVATIMLLAWIFHGLKVEFMKIYEDWRAISVAQARKTLRVPDTLDLATAVLALQRNDFQTASAILWLSAERGDATAQYVLSGLFRTGKGVPRSRAEALKWLRRSAEQGLTEAEADLGEQYIDDNPIQAVEWLKRAAVKGDSLSQHRLGTLYEKGRGVPKDGIAAAEWYREAAESGHERAQRALGTMYLGGRGVEADMVQAYAWLRLAAEKGDRRASHLLYKAASALPADAQANSEWLVGEWRTRIQQALHAPTAAERKRLRKMAEMSVFARIRQALAAVETVAEGAPQTSAAPAAQAEQTPAPAAAAQARTSAPAAAPEEEAGDARPTREARGRGARRGLARRAEAPEQRQVGPSSPAADAAAKAEGLGNLRDRIAQRAETARQRRSGRGAAAEGDQGGAGADGSADPRAERVRRSAAQLSSRLNRSQRRGGDGGEDATPAEAATTGSSRLAQREARRSRRKPIGNTSVEDRLANLPGAGGAEEHRPTDTTA